MKKITLILMAFVALTMTTYAQWSLQTNPLGSGDAAMVGKVQFVSATEGWIACGSNGNLLHTTNGGTNWNIITPFHSDSLFNMSDPASTMSWINPTHGWALKTVMSGTDDFSVDANGSVLYGTIDGGNNWTKKVFPKTITTTTYNQADLTGSWQFYALTTKNPSVSTSISGWMYGVASIDANGNCTISISRSNSTTKSPTLTMGISSRGRITLNGSEIGFLSADKNTAFMTGDEDNGGFSIYIMQKKIASTSYNTADLQGTWQMHGLSAGNASSQYSGWIHAALTADANGNFTGTAYGPDNSPVSINTTAVISSTGVISGLTSISSFTNGFMSADKKTFYLVMTGANNDYNLVAFQKKLPTTTYSSSDFQGIWREHTLITMNTNNSLDNNIKTTGFITGYLKLDASGKGIVNNSASSDSIAVNIDITNGVITTPPVLNGSTNIHGYMSDDKKTMILTMTDVYGGYEIGMLQKDVSVSGDIGLQVQFADANTGWLSNYNMIYEGFKLYKTTDGGTTWNVINGVNNPVGGLYCFVDANNGWLIGSSGSLDNGGMTNIYHTTDGGLSFTLQASNVGNAKQIFFSDLLNGWVVGKGGLIMKTVDGGTHWSNVTHTGQVSNSSNKSVFFLNANQGWISGGNDNTEGIGTRYVLATTDGGTSWTIQPTLVTNDIFSLSFWDANHGWLTSDHGQIAQYSSNNAQAKSVTITAGGLSTTLTSTEQNTITNLTVNGTIDARDFKTMRDNMPMLTSVDLSGTNVVEYVGTDGTYNINSIDYPANTIPQGAFYNMATITGKISLSSFIFPASTTDIGLYAFRASGLTSITIPSKVTSIGYGNFVNCYKLTSVVIPSSVKTIGDYAFFYCNALSTINIPSTITSIGSGTFSYSGLNSLTLVDGISTIGDYAFQKCSSLSSVSLPSTVTHSGYCAFTFDNALTSFSVSGGNLNYSSVDGVLYNKSKQKLLCYPGGKGTDFVIPSTVSVIDTAAFEGSNRIRNIIIPSSVTNLSAEAFYWCTNLKTIDIPASVSSIGAYAFYNCSGLTSITVHTVTPVNLSSSDSVFNYVNKSSCILNVPVNSKAAYKGVNQWKDFTNIIETTTAVSTVIDERINLYPNPASVGFYINTGEKINTVSIYNLNGEMILSKEVIDNNFINISDLKPGVYFVKVQTENGIIVRKLIKKQL